MSERAPIDRADTAIRLVLSLLFLLIAGVVELVLRVLVAFSLIYAFVLAEPPSDTVRGFANRITAYLYRIYRYLTYNEARAPFPFAELEDPLEPSNWSRVTSESELLSRSRGEHAEPDAPRE